MLITLFRKIDSPEYKDKFEDLYMDYHNLMFSIAMDLLDDEVMAEDAVSEAFLRIIKQFNKIVEMESSCAKKYVVLTTKSVCIDMLRKKKRTLNTSSYEQESIANKDEDKSQSIEDEVFLRYDLEHILQTVRGLPEIYKTTLMLFALEDVDIQTIAGVMNCDKETVKKRLYRARKELRRRLKERDE